jgi:uncharacterized protein
MRYLFILSSILLFSCKSVVDNFAFYPNKTSIIKQEDLPEYVKLVEIPTSDNLLIQALYYHNEYLKFEDKLIIYFHGNAENMYSRLKEAQQLFNFGYNVLIISYRGYAKSQGKPTEKGIYIDGESALEYSKNQLGYDLGNIIIYGRSIGTTVAVEISQKKLIEKLILITPLSNGKDFAKSKGLGYLNSMVGNAFDSINKLQNIEVPLLIIHGNRDNVVSIDDGRKLFNSYKHEKIFIEIDGGGHNNLEKINPQLFWGSIESFLEK